MQRRSEYQPGGIAAPGFAGRTFLPPRARRDLKTLHRWRDAAADGYFDIEGWRGSVDRRSSYDDPKRRWPEPPEEFAEDTEAVLYIASRRLPQLDTQWIARVGSAIMTWFERRSAATLPMPIELERLHDKAMRCIRALEREILEAAADYPVKDAEDVSAVTSHSTSVLNAAMSGAPDAAARARATTESPRVPAHDLVTLADLIDVIQAAKVRNPRTLRTWGIDAIYKGVAKERQRREAGRTPDRSALYGVIVDAFDASTQRYRKGQFAEGLKRFLKQRLKADGVLEEAARLARVEGDWNTERSTPRR